MRDAPHMCRVFAHALRPEREQQQNVLLLASLSQAGWVAVPWSGSLIRVHLVPPHVQTAGGVRIPRVFEMPPHDGKWAALMECGEAARSTSSVTKLFLLPE